MSKLQNGARAFSGEGSANDSVAVATAAAVAAAEEAAEEAMMMEPRKLSNGWQKPRVFEVLVRICYPQWCYLRLNDLLSQLLCSSVRGKVSVEMYHGSSLKLPHMVGSRNRWSTPWPKSSGWELEQAAGLERMDPSKESGHIL